jgi:arylsulfatase
VYKFWRCVDVQKAAGEYAQTFIEFPQMQKGASFNMDAVKKRIEAAQRKF